MRSVGWLVLLAVVLVVLHRLSGGAPLEARAALALGALVVSAEIAGRIALRWRLPRVAGFVAAGVVLRVNWPVTRLDEVTLLQFAGDAALALFALRAGLAWRQGGDAAEPVPGLGRFLATSLVLPFAVTAAAVYALHIWFPLTRHQPAGDVLAVALVLGAFSAVAAPGLTWATLDDAPSGPLAHTLLRLHALRDVAAVLLFAAALVLGRPLADPGTLKPLAFIPPLAALGAAGFAGALLAALTARLWKVGGPRTDPGIFILGVAVGAALAARAGPAEVTLAALAAGVGLGQFAPGAATALRERFDAHGGALAAVAFVLFGARLGASALLELWPWVIVLAVVRAAGLYWGGRWAARGPLVTGDLARAGWLGLIGQAGVGLLLAAAGRRAFPEWGVSFETLAVALVALHAVVGPICLRRALAQRPALMP